MSIVSLKEQIIALNLDLEDKIKVGELLERRIEKARKDFDLVESIVRERFSSSLKDEKDKNKSIAEDITRKTEELVAEKAQLINELKERVNDIQQAEHDLQAEIRSLYREAERELEMERKRFKSGYEDRLQKVSILSESRYKCNVYFFFNPVHYPKSTRDQGFDIQSFGTRV
jgi:uncharacterized protein YoxC